METAEILRASFAETDLVARVGKTRFIALAMVSPDRPLPQILDSLARNLDAHGREPGRVKVSMRIGYAVSTSEAPCEFHNLLAAAERAMCEDGLQLSAAQAALAASGGEAVRSGPGQRSHR